MKSKPRDGVSDRDYLLIDYHGNLAGNAELRTLRFPVASLFKIILAFGALESQKIKVNEELVCVDCQAKAGKQRLTLREALFYSSNDFFKQLTARLHSRDLASAMRELKFPSNPPNEEVLQKEWNTLWRGGSIQVSPLELFALTTRLAEMAGKGEHAAFIGTLERLNEKSTVRVFGKTGTWGGAAWCTGFSMDRESEKVIEVVTVLFQYTVPHWQSAHQRASEEFYRGLAVNCSS